EAAVLFMRGCCGAEGARRAWAYLSLLDLGRAIGMRVVFVVKVVHEGGDFHFRLDFAIAVAFLQHSGELFRLTTQYGEVVVGELAPLMPNFTLYLMPLA